MLVETRCAAGYNDLCFDAFSLRDADSKTVRSTKWNSAWRRHLTHWIKDLFPPSFRVGNHWRSERTNGDKFSVLGLCVWHELTRQLSSKLDEREKHTIRRCGLHSRDNKWKILFPVLTFFRLTELMYKRWQPLKHTPSWNYITKGLSSLLIYSKRPWTRCSCHKGVL